MEILGGILVMAVFIGIVMLLNKGKAPPAKDNYYYYQNYADDDDSDDD